MAGAIPRDVNFSRMYENPELEVMFRSAVDNESIGMNSSVRPETKRAFLEANIFDIFSDHARPIERHVGTEYYYAEAERDILLNGIRDSRGFKRRFYYVPNATDTFRYVGTYIEGRTTGSLDGTSTTYYFRKPDGTINEVPLSYDGLSLFITKAEYEERAAATAPVARGGARTSKKQRRTRRRAHRRTHRRTYRRTHRR